MINLYLDAYDDGIAYLTCDDKSDRVFRLNPDNTVDEVTYATDPPTRTSVDLVATLRAMAEEGEG